MLRNSLLLWPAALLVGALGLNGCNSAGGNFAKTKSGIEYKVFDKSGKARDIKPETAEADYKKRLGQIIALHVEYRTAKDSVLFQSRKQQMGFPVRVPLQDVARKGGLEEAISLLQAGDSAVFRFNADTLSMKTTGQPAPPQIKKHGNTMTLFVKVAAIEDQATAMANQQKDQQAAMAQMQKHAEQQKPVDEKTIQEYVQKNNLKAQKTASGLHYVVTQPGTGAKPTQGQLVSVNYRGTLLNGKEFDSSAKGNGGKPIEFPIGVGAVIPGWDEGIALLNKGTKATLLIPSGLAYGQRGAGNDIPADAVLRFDVELVDVKAAPAPQPGMGMMPGGGAPAGR
ncbi:FKBP-type peptidyl-prolyl cis-trans isomerase [Hymenobacter latericus]|uniref:FKBP-type peptidyl-prolyl cis-trans isomerase n=1 Tax=Hymenobacter sp. YIM 151858-1 TaxID=2987688 RepID=UPI002226393A|nr:FKBP-type peptidyl-prolyl cis-trans isomerase [Hymenobacter sp. YIM 151858-1]UYZ57713.1 FKBP-type peptidyl-prolyl cis-trans isomerase [Hymenobacter sp. YIM 151858-1]